MEESYRKKNEKEFVFSSNTLTSPSYPPLSTSAPDRPTSLKDIPRRARSKSPKLVHKSPSTLSREESDGRRSPRFFPDFPPSSQHRSKQSHGENDLNTAIEVAMKKVKDLDFDEDVDKLMTSPVDGATMNHWKMNPDLVRHVGGCHCGAIRYEVYASPTPKVIECNCSICVKKQNRHFIVPHSRFKLLKGHDSLSTYTFNSHKAKHIFCSVCGVQSFYIPRSNSDGYGIVPHCLEEGTLMKEKIEKFDGRNWDQEIKKKSHILEYSKEKV